jgi:hypothetical protein
MTSRARPRLGYLGVYEIAAFQIHIFISENRYHKTSYNLNYIYHNEKDIIRCKVVLYTLGLNTGESNVVHMRMQPSNFINTLLLTP